MLERISFERKTKTMTDRELIEFTAQQLYAHCQNDHDHRKTYGISGFISAIIAGAIMGLGYLFIKK